MSHLRHLELMKLNPVKQAHELPFQPWFASQVLQLPLIKKSDEELQKHLKLTGSQTLVPGQEMVFWGGATGGWIGAGGHTGSGILVHCPWAFCTNPARHWQIHTFYELLKVIIVLTELGWQVISQMLVSCTHLSPIEQKHELFLVVEFCGQARQTFVTLPNPYLHSHEADSSLYTSLIPQMLVHNSPILMKPALHTHSLFWRVEFDGQILGGTGWTGWIGWQMPCWLLSKPLVQTQLWEDSENSSFALQFLWTELFVCRTHAMAESLTCPSLHLHENTFLS